MARLFSFVLLFYAVIVESQTKYENLYRNETYLANLPQLLSDCMGGLSDISNKVDCNDADYIQRVMKAYNYLTADTEPTNTPLIATVPKTSSYEMLFTDYLAVNQPFKSSLENPLDNTSENMAIDCEKGANIPLNKCRKYQQISDSFVIPKVAANNYLFRLPSSPQEIFDYKLHWPSLLNVNSGETPIVQKCPQNMHMLVWGASHSMRVRIFPEAAGHAFSPTNTGMRLGQIQLDRNTEDENENDANVKDDGVKNVPLPLHITTYDGSGFPKISTYLSEINGEKKTFDKIPRFAEIKLDKDDYVFIPHNHLVSFYPSSISEKKIDGLRELLLDTEDKRISHMYQVCFMDASNLNKFKDSLDLSSRISEYDQSVLVALQMGGIDLKMERSVNDILLNDLLIRKTPAMDSTDSTTIVSDSGDIPDVSATVGGRSKRTRASGEKKGGGSSFRDWQESNKWTLLITSLTLPRPMTPTVKHTGIYVYVYVCKCI
jgi:hypothetical protein